MKVSLTTHSAPAKRQGWSAVEVKIDLASKAADFICDARHCQGGMFYAGTILQRWGSSAGSTCSRNQPGTLEGEFGLVNHVCRTP